jgi:hypothetical protein
MTPYPRAVTGPYLMLCEGQSDNRFFKKLCESRERKIPEFQFLFPPSPEESKDSQHDGVALYGKDGFVNMLAVLNSIFEFKPEVVEAIRGILLVIDACDDATKAFSDLRDQIAAAGKFGVPNGPVEIARSADRPPISVLVVGNEANKGGLESLCFAALADTKQKEAGCLEQFLTCCELTENTWNAEKFDKTRLACLIAVTYEPNPTRGISNIFNSHKGAAPAVDIEAARFDETYQAIRNFCEETQPTTRA